jgi:hypothetical protein
MRSLVGNGDAWEYHQNILFPIFIQAIVREQFFRRIFRVLLKITF